LLASIGAGRVGRIEWEGRISSARRASPSIDDGSEREILRLVNLRFKGMGVRVGMVAQRRVLGVAMACGALAAVAMGQVAVPRYQSPIETPRPHPLAIPAPAAATANGTVVEFPIVRVNDQLIDKSDYERAQDQLLQTAQHENLEADELAERQKNLLRDMIDQQLLLSRGKELDINADTEVIRQLDDIRKKNNLDSMEALEKACLLYTSRCV